MSESDLSNSELKKKSSIILKTKSSSTLKKSKETIPDINIPKTSRINRSPSAKVLNFGLQAVKINLCLGKKIARKYKYYNGQNKIS